MLSLRRIGPKLRRAGRETALSSSGAALAFHDLWSGDVDLQTANQWNALGTEAVPSNATWLLWNGGSLTDGANDGPAALWTWINAAKWRALTADTVGTTAGDGTGMLFADWCASDIGDGTPDFTRRDAVIGRTSADIPLLMGPQTGESYFGASLMYITQAVATPGGGASSFADLTGMIADSQVPAAFTRDSELASLIDDITISGSTLTITLQDGSTETRTLPSGGGGITQSAADDRYLNEASNLSDLDSTGTARTNLGLGTAAVEDTGIADGDIPVLSTGGALLDARVPASITRDTQLASYAELAGATFTGAARGLDPASAQDFVTKAYADIHYAGGSAPTDHDLWAGWSSDASVDGTEVQTGASSDSNSVTLPISTGNQYMFIWRANADGGDPTEVHISGGGNVRNTFGDASALEVDSVAGQLIISVTTQNAALLGGETVRVV